MTYLDLIAGLGGMFGLFLGFSIISFLEILYWVTARLLRNITRYLNTFTTTQK